MAAVALAQTTIGKKVIMAVTGFVLVAFVVLHMAGNLHVFEGARKMNAYGAFLREVGDPLIPHEGLLWLARLVLLACVVLHVWAAYSLTRLDLDSRPVGYRARRNLSEGYAARIMRWGGVILAVFIVYHILHMTTGSLHPGFREGDVYQNIVIGFQSPGVVFFYLVAMVALGMHLRHGVWSMAQTLGWVNRENTRRWRLAALVLTVVVVAGFVSVPLSVAVGNVR